MNYQAHYDRLTKIAQTLSKQEQVDVDQLLPLVDDAMQSYAFCKARIDAVEQLLTQKLNSDPTLAEKDQDALE